MPRPHGGLELWSLDRQPTWDVYVRALNYEFAQFDFDGDASPEEVCAAERVRAAAAAAALPGAAAAVADDSAASSALGAFDATGGSFDWIILSNVLMYCDDERTADRLAAILGVGASAAAAPARCRAALVNERATSSGMARRLRERGVRVVSLLSQDVGVDERQMIFCSPTAARRLDACAERRRAAAAAVTPAAPSGASGVFPNVPYEEGKVAARAARTSSGGHRGSRF